MPDLTSPSIYKADLHVPPAGAYLNTAAESPLLRSVAESLGTYAHDKGRGEPGRTAFEAKVRSAKGRVAEILGGSADQVAFCYTASDALGLVANSIPWRRGDKVIVSDFEYPSVLLAWLRLADRGVEIDVVSEPPEAWQTDTLLQRIDERTRLVAVSAVSYRTGHRADLRRLRAAVHAHGGWLLADATQALGAVSVQADEADIIVASAFKWMMGVHGLGVLYVAPGTADSLQPPYAGWRSVVGGGVADDGSWRFSPSAARFEAGMPGFPAIYGLDAGLAYLQRVGLQTVWRRVAGLSAAAVAGLQELGVPLLTPRHPERRAGIVAFKHPNAEAVAAALQRAGVFVFAPVPDVLRISPHFFNDADDVAQCLRGLEKVLAGHRS